MEFIEAFIKSTEWTIQ